MDFISLLESNLGRKATPEFLPMQPGDVKDTWADTSLLSRDFGYSPSISLDEGIADSRNGFSNINTVKLNLRTMTTYSQDKTESDRRVLELLSQNFGNISTAATEIINLEAILNLPKGTEHFIADIHGESEAFRHILKNASGNIKRKVNEIFSTSLREDDIRQLCSLIYYPERKLALIRSTEKGP